MSFGSAGAGSIHHLTFAIFAERVGIELLHAPYRGGSAMVNGLLTGEIQAGWSGIPNVMELIAAGKLRGLCVSTLQRRHRRQRSGLVTSSASRVSTSQR